MSRRDPARGLPLAAGRRTRRLRRRWSSVAGSPMNPRRNDEAGAERGGHAADRMAGHMLFQAVEHYAAYTAGLDKTVAQGGGGIFSPIFQSAFGISYFFGGDVLERDAEIGDVGAQFSDILF